MRHASLCFFWKHTGKEIYGNLIGSLTHLLEAHWHIDDSDLDTPVATLVVAPGEKRARNFD